MRVFAKRKLEFTNYIQTNAGTEVGGSVTVEPLVFTTTPDWIVNDPLFGWAQKDGLIEVMEDVAQQKALENDPNATTGGKKGKKTDPTEPPATPPEVPPATPPAGDA